MNARQVLFARTLSRYLKEEIKFAIYLLVRINCKEVSPKKVHYFALV